MRMEWRGWKGKERDDQKQVVQKSVRNEEWEGQENMEIQKIQLKSFLPGWG